MTNLRNIADLSEQEKRIMRLRQEVENPSGGIAGSNIKLKTGRQSAVKKS